MNVFITLLLISKNGVWESGRFLLADICNLNPSTLYSTLNLLKLQQQINIKTNNRFSTISICKWKEYQQPNNNQKSQTSTTNQQPNNTLNKNIRIKEYKNIERKIITPTQKLELIKYLVEKGMNKELVESELNKFISYWTEKTINGKKERWQLEKTFEVKKRLATWFGNINKFGGKNARRTNVNLDRL